MSRTMWTELVSTALVGTERRPVPDGLEDQLRTVLDGNVPTTSVEEVVLSGAAVLGVLRRVGRMPASGGRDQRERADDDPRPVASPTATQVLDLLLSGQLVIPGGPGPLVREWLERCATGGRRLPERMLPALLAAGTVDVAARSGAIAAGGPRLTWLAGQNPEWAWATTSPTGAGSDDDEDEWTTGTSETRLARLESLRGNRPESARRLVEASWRSEGAKNRAAILLRFATGLGPDDEPFLEHALDDRSRPVREAAADLLARIPTSQLAARMAARARPLVSVVGRRRKRLAVDLPDQPDDATRRDGVVDTGAPPKTGRRSWWLTQLVAAAPLATWEEAGVDPDGFARLVDQPELVDGLVRAAHRQQDGRWAAALLRSHVVPSLLALVDEGERATVAAPVIGSVPDGQLGSVLEALPGPWSPGTSEAALARLRSIKAAAVIQSALPVVAARLDPISIDAVERWIEDLRAADHLRSLVRGLAHALTIRRTIAEELA